MTAGAARVRQHLEADPRGLRWVNLTGLKAELKDGTPVEIRCQGGRSTGPAVTLRTFANRLDLSRPMLSWPRTRTMPRSARSACGPGATRPS